MDLVREVALALQAEAQERGSDSPVDYGDAEQLARVAIEVIRKHGGPLPVYRLDEVPEGL